MFGLTGAELIHFVECDVELETIARKIKLKFNNKKNISNIAVHNF